MASAPRHHWAVRTRTARRILESQELTLLSFPTIAATCALPMNLKPAPFIPMLIVLVFITVDLPNKKGIQAGSFRACI